MRVMADCRRFESDNNCTLRIIGEESEVLDVAAQHAVSAHGHAEGPELREQIRTILEPQENYVPRQREPQPFLG
jgi:uncharacterized protein DUF1059